MKTTIKEFKQISESFEQGTEYLIVVQNCHSTLTKNSWEDGETDQVNSWNLTLNKTYKNVDDLINSISSTFGCSFDKKHAVIIDNSLHLDVTVDEDTNDLSEEELKLWKEGKFEAFNLHVYCAIELYVTQPVTDSQEISKILDIENYD